MRYKFSFPVLSLVFAFLFSSISVFGEDNPATITAENLTNLAQIRALQSPYLGDIQWSSDSAWLAIGTSGYGVQLFQTANLNAITQTPLAGSTDVLFSPTNQELASGGAVWDFANLTSLFEYGDVDTKQFSPDGQYFITVKRGENHSEFSLWEVPIGEIVQNFVVEDVRAFQTMVFSADSSRYAIAFHSTDIETFGNSFIQIRDIDDAESLVTIELSTTEVKTLALSNAGQSLVVEHFEDSYGATPTRFSTWEIDSNTQSHSIEYFGYAVFSPDKKWAFIPPTYDNPAMMVSLDRLEFTYYILDEDVYIDEVKRVYSPDGRYFAFSYGEQVSDYTENGVMVWELSPWTDVRSPKKLLLDYMQGAGAVQSFAFSPDGQLIAVGYAEQTVIWDLATETILRTIEQSGELRFIADAENMLVIGTSLWDVATGEQLEGGLSFYGLPSPNGRFSAYISPESLKIGNVVAGEEVSRPLLPDYLGRLLAFDAANGVAIFKGTEFFAYDVNSGERLLEINSSVEAVALSADASLLVASQRSEPYGGDMLATVYHLHDASVAPIPLEGVVRNLQQFGSLIISPNGRYILSNKREMDSYDTFILALYDAETGALLKEWRTEALTEIDFSPDSQYFFNTGQFSDAEGDRSLLMNIWSVADVLDSAEPAPIASMELGGFAHTYGMEFSPDGSQVIVSFDDSELGDGPWTPAYHSYVFDWETLLSGGLNQDAYAINSLSFEGAYLPKFNSSSPIALSNGSEYIWELKKIVSNLDLWDSSTGEQILSLTGFSHGIFSPDGSLLAALSDDGQLTIWSVENLLAGEETPLLILDSPDVLSIRFSPDGASLYQQTSYGVIVLGIAAP